MSMDISVNSELFIPDGLDVEGPITSMISASALQLHRSCRIVIDEDAPTELQGHEYYRRLFENEPEWQEFHDDLA